LEAFACGCPAVISNTSSLPEIGAAAAVYFNPADEKNMSREIERVINDAGLRRQMVLSGYEQLKKFSWEKTASRTLEVYRSLI
jgi:glycosyltransferase involved in cell wall biosynthesis